MSSRTRSSLFAIAAIGFAMAGACFSATGANASPLNGRHGGGHGGGGYNHQPHWCGFAGCNNHGGGHGGGWGNGGGWGGHWNVGNYSYNYLNRPTCRLVERENRWGEIVVRRVCYPGY